MVQTHHLPIMFLKSDGPSRCEQGSGDQSDFVSVR